jgi:hypothetical protein
LELTETDNDFYWNIEAEETKWHRMAKVHNILERWQGSQNLCATQKKSCDQNKQMAAVGYISDIEEIVKAFWSNCLQDGVAAFQLSKRLPMRPALLTKDLRGR